MAYFLEGLASLATGAAAITAVFTAFGLFIAGITYLLKLPDRFRAYFFYRPRHIVIPTPEEMAKYCIKEFDTYRPNENDLREEMEHGYIRYRRKFSNITTNRIAVAMSLTFCIYLSFLAKLLYYGFLNGPDDKLKGVAGVMTLLVVLIATMIAAILWLDRLTQRSLLRGLILFKRRWSASS